MSFRTPSVFWAFIFLVFFLSLYVLSDMLLPFAMGLVLAYLFAPVLDWFEARRWRRGIAAMGIVIVFFLVIIGFSAAIVPMLTTEAATFAARQPVMMEHLQSTLSAYLDGANGTNLTGLFENHMDSAMSVGSNVVTGAAAGGQAAAMGIVLLFLVPVISYFMMKEWPQIISALSDLWPRPMAVRARAILAKIDARIAGFVRGQLIVCLILAVYYGFALWIVGISYGLLIGLVGGILTMIPFVGSIFVLLATALMGIFGLPDAGSGPLYWGLGLVVLGQVAEGNYITPKIVGDRVGLHPLWIIFSLMAFGHVMGFFGLLLAVPVAAAIAVLVSEGLLWYKQSTHYRGTPKDTAS